jgi:hypothetical protein
MTTEKQIKKDLVDIGFYFYKPELFNVGQQELMYQVKTTEGLSRHILTRLNKKGIRFFSLTLNNPKNGLSLVTILFYRKI